MKNLVLKTFWVLPKKLEIDGDIMPKCKNCGTRLTKFDNEICPVCGVEHPLEGVSSETIEITSKLDIDKEEFKDYHPTKRINVFLFFFYIIYKLN